MAQSLIIKDGNGNNSALSVESGSTGLIPIHYVTSSTTNPLYVVNNPVTTVTKTSVTSFDWTTPANASGTFSIASNSATRKGLTIFNPGPNNLYIGLSTAGGTQNGLTVTNTSSAPTEYSFILYPSGTYVADSTTVGVQHGGYFISGSVSLGVFITQIS